jgi:hypothetical protein
VTSAVSSPYRGLVPYSADDQALFFGRERETALVVDNLMASRFTLLYGASGVGKSSILHAGVMSALRRRARLHVPDEGPPEFVPVIVQQWSGDPVRELLDAVRRAVSVHTRDPRDVAVAGAPLDESLAQVTDEVGEVLLILDQFEEYFLHHPDEDGAGTFAVELPRVLQQAELSVSVLVSIREEALGALDRFSGRIPHLFERYLRIEHLDRDAARAAIEGPLRHRHQPQPDAPESIEQGLVEAVLDQVETRSVGLGAGVTAGPGRAGGRIEAPYLQIVMQRLWEVERAEGSPTLRLATLHLLGGATTIVSRHLSGALDRLSEAERATAAAVFRFLVTPTGAKLTLSVSDLAEYTGRPVAEVESLIERLAGGGQRILRVVAAPYGDDGGQPRYEIFHDVLTASIQDWRREYETQRRVEVASRPTGWRRLRRARRKPVEPRE